MGGVLLMFTSQYSFVFSSINQQVLISKRRLKIMGFSQRISIKVYQNDTCFSSYWASNTAICSADMHTAIVTQIQHEVVCPIHHGEKKAPCLGFKQRGYMGRQLVQLWLSLSIGQGQSQSHSNTLNRSSPAPCTLCPPAYSHSFCFNYPANEQ